MPYKNQNKTYTDNQINFLINNTEHNDIPLHLISKVLNKSLFSIQVKKSRLSESSKLTKAAHPNNFKRWKEEEINRLKEDIQKYSYPVLAQMYKRTEESIRRKATKIFGTSLLSEIRGEYTTIWLSQFFNVHPTTLKKWIDNYKLPHRKITLSKGADVTQHLYIIQLSKIFAWMKIQTETNPNFIFDFGNVNLKLFEAEKNQIKDEWFVYHCNNKTHFGIQRRWTKKEEETLIEDYLQKVPARITATKLNRTTYSINKKVRLLKKNNAIPFEYYPTKISH